MSLSASRTKKLNNALALFNAAAFQAVALAGSVQTEKDRLRMEDLKKTLAASYAEILDFIEWGEAKTETNQPNLL